MHVKVVIIITSVDKDVHKLKLAVNVLWAGKFLDKNAALILPGSRISIFEELEFEFIPSLSAR